MKENQNISKKTTWDEGRNIRLKEFFDYKQLSQEEFSEIMKYSQSNLNAILRNKRALGDKIIKKYLVNFPELNINWILTGYGEMLKEEQQAGSLTTNEETGVHIPYYDIDFAGGWSSEEMFSHALPSFYINSPDFSRAEFACNIVGHSMSKRIKSGAIVGLRKIEDWQTYFPTNEIYGVIMKNDLRTIKIVKRCREKEGFLELIPDPLDEYNNPTYETETVHMDFISHFYQVVAWAYFERIAQ
ncbi:MAG: S24 family peptidase [Bergeyella cardium]